MNERDRIYKKVKSIIKEKGGKSSYIGENDFVSIIKDGIKINFHIKNSTLNIENIFRAIKRAQKIVRDKFDYNIEKLWIDIFDSIGELRQEGKSKSRYASWIAGIYDGRIRLISEQENEEPEALYIILTHEIIHLAICDISAGLCPYWLDEGLAIYLSQELSDAYLGVLKKAVEEDKTIPLEILEGPLPSDTEQSIRQLAYSEVFSITEFLIESYDWRKIESIIQQCRRRPIDTILIDMGLNYYLIEQGWKRWVRERNA
jgi:hypothetical protein